MRRARGIVRRIALALAAVLNPLDVATLAISERLVRATKLLRRKRRNT
jgi:hypothetical protein